MIFQSEDYKQILREVLHEKKASVSKRFTFQRMADACNVEKTYLSRVLNGDGHLSQDQLFMACVYLGMSVPERQYVRLLHQYQRSSVAKHQAELSAEIRVIKQRLLKSESHLSPRTSVIDSQEMSEYFLDPNAQLVHMFLTSKKYASDLPGIARRLKLTEEELLEAIGRLERAGIIELDDRSYVVKIHNLHLPSDSVYYKSYRLAVRMKSLEKMQTLSRDKAYSLSVLFSSTPKVRDRVHVRFLEFLKDIENLVKSDIEEEVYQLNFDLLPWSE